MTSAPAAVGRPRARCSSAATAASGGATAAVLGGGVAAVRSSLGGLGQRLRHRQHRSDGDAATHSDSVNASHAAALLSGVSRVPDHRASLAASIRVESWPRPRSRPPEPLIARDQAIVAAAEAEAGAGRGMHYGSSSAGPILAAGLRYQAFFVVFAALWVGVLGRRARARRQPRAARRALRVDRHVDARADRRGRRRRDRRRRAARSRRRSAGRASSPSVGIARSPRSRWLAVEPRGLPCATCSTSAPRRPTSCCCKLGDLGLGDRASACSCVVSSAVLVARQHGARRLAARLARRRRELGGRAPSLHAILGLVLAFAARHRGARRPLYRVLAGGPDPAPPLWPGALLGAVGARRAQGCSASALLGGATNNPLIASFAVHRRSADLVQLRLPGHPDRRGLGRRQRDATGRARARSRSASATRRAGRDAAAARDRATRCAPSPRRRLPPCAAQLARDGDASRASDASA